MFRNIMLLSIISIEAQAKGGSGEISAIGVGIIMIVVIYYLIASNDKLMKKRWARWLVLILASPILLIVKLGLLYNYLKDKYNRSK